MATNPFCESVWEHFILTNTQCIARRGNYPAKNSLFSEICQPKADRKPQKEEKGGTKYIFYSSRRTTAPVF